MRKAAFLLLTLALLTCSCLSFAGDVYVNGYYRSNGTYVEPHYRSSPNNTVTDNYNYVGNTNPHTGQVGSDYYRNSPSSPYYNGSSSNNTINSNNSNPWYKTRNSDYGN